MFSAWHTAKQRVKASRFFSGEQPVKGVIELTHRRIFIVPTANGFGFMLLLVVLLLIAFVYNNNLTYLLAFLLTSLFVVTILHTFRSLSGLKVRMGAHKPVFVGQMVALPLTLENPSAVVRYHLEIELEHREICDVAPFTQQPVSVYITPQRRGWHACGLIRITCRFPLGLFRAWSLLRFDQPLLVYPKPANVSQPFPVTADSQNKPGQTHQGGGEDFYGLQEYQAGDAIKHIHWKTYAKGQGVFIKHYSQAQSAELWLEYASTPGQSSEERISQLCRWVIDAESTGLLYGLNLPSARLLPAKGAVHCAKCLEALALA